MKFTMEANSGVPAGGYPAEFIGAEAFENDYGPGVRLKWRVLEGDHTGTETSRIVSQKLSPKSNLCKFVKSLKGADIEAGEQIDLMAYAGTRGLIVVEETESGSTRVGSFMRQQ
ncbi:MAG: hypothetical protein NXI04_01605 [Planctomycetaceae bacterium]|nr:hypothetical protein [Planctomycetaceae bacterium]